MYFCRRITFAFIKYIWTVCSPLSFLDGYQKPRLQIVPEFSSPYAIWSFADMIAELDRMRHFSC